MNLTAPRFAGITTTSCVFPMNAKKDETPAAPKAVFATSLTDNDVWLSPDNKQLGNKFVLTANEQGEIQGFKLDKKAYLPLTDENFTQIFSESKPVSLSGDQVKPFLMQESAFGLFMSGLSGKAAETETPAKESPLQAFVRMTKLQFTEADIEKFNEQSRLNNRSFGEKIKDSVKGGLDRVKKFLHIK